LPCRRSRGKFLRRSKNAELTRAGRLSLSLEP
jgi:hypothetical protein